MLLILAAFAQAQTTPTPVDCQFSATFTVSTLTTASYYNRGPSAPCIAWRLTYSTQNATGVSISLQGTNNLPNGNPDPAGWTNLTVTAPVTNPATGTAAGTIAACCDYYPWIRAIAGTFTGAAQTMSLTVLGYKGTSASRNTGGGGASIAHVTQTLKGDGAGNAVGIGASDTDCVHPNGSSGTCVPYTGATADVNLGTHSETLNNITINGTCSGTGCPTGPAGPAGPAGPPGPAGPTTHTLNLSVNGNGAPITAGSQGFTYAPAACTIGTWTILADVAGNIAIDLKRSTYAVFPTNASIVGAGNPPTLASVQKNQAAAASWTSTAILAGDVIEFVVSAPSLVTRVNLTVECN